MNIKEQLEQYIDRRSEKQSERSVRDFGQLSDTLVVSRINHTRGANDIAELLLIAVDALRHTFPGPYGENVNHFNKKALAEIQEKIKGE